MLPNFLVIGAGKSGTTSLYHYCKEHPEVYMSPVKEPRFFAFEGQKLDFRGPGDQEMNSRMSSARVITDIKEYEVLFRGVTDEKAVGEASPAYLHNPEAPGRIKKRIPDAKLVAILRNPADRAYSAFLHQVRHGREPCQEFTEALREEGARAQKNWAPNWRYKGIGFYHAHLKRYFETFGPDRIRVYLHEDLKRNPAGTMRDVYRFVGVDDSFRPDTATRHNEAGVLRNGLLRAAVSRSGALIPAVKNALQMLPAETRGRIRKSVFVEPPPLDPKVRGELLEEYREDILKLQDLIGRDLSGWLEGVPRVGKT